MKLNSHIGNVDIKIDTSRIDKNIKEAQKLLNEQIVADCDPLIPFQQGALRNSVTYPDGIYGETIQWGGEEVGVPYAHYQYVGEVYGPNYPIFDSAGNLTGYYSPPKKTPAGIPLHYHTEGTSNHWFEKAKEQHKDDWVRLVKETVGKE